MRSKESPEQPVCKRMRVEKKWNNPDTLDIAEIIENVLMPMKDKVTYTTFSMDELETAETIVQHLLRECPKITESRASFSRYMLYLYDRVRQC